MGWWLTLSWKGRGGNWLPPPVVNCKGLFWQLIWLLTSSWNFHPTTKVCGLCSGWDWGSVPTSRWDHLNGLPQWYLYAIKRSQYLNDANRPTTIPPHFQANYSQPCDFLEDNVIRKRKEKKIAFVSRYPHECEHVSLLLIMLLHDAT